MWFIGVKVEEETSAPRPKKKTWIRPCGCPHNINHSEKANSKLNFG